MFSGAGAESLCSRAGSESGYAVTGGGAGANLAPVNHAPTSKTVTARDVAFPLADPYSPVRNAGVPVPGYTAWPGRANRLGRRYYGLGKIEAKDAFKKPSGFAGLGAFEPGWDSEIGLPPAMPPIGSSGGGSGGINWDTFFGGLFKTLPGTISAITGRGDPLLRTQPSYQPSQPTNYGTPPEGWSYNSSGQLVKDAVGSVTDFVSENPLLVGGAILGVVLLFMKSPSGRR